MKSNKHKGKVHISIGFWLVLAVLLYLDGQGFVIICLAACFAHEFGHWLAIRSMGGAIQSIQLTAVGAEMKFDMRHMLSYRREVVACAAGPGVNFLLAGISVFFEWYLFAGINLSFGAINLLPIEVLDGGRILSCVLRIYCPLRADTIMHWVNVAAAGVLAGVGWTAWTRWGNLTLLCVVLWLIYGALNNKNK